MKQNNKNRDRDVSAGTDQHMDEHTWCENMTSWTRTRAGLVLLAELDHLDPPCQLRADSHRHHLLRQTSRLKKKKKRWKDPNGKTRSGSSLQRRNSWTFAFPKQSNKLWTHWGVSASFNLIILNRLELLVWPTTRWKTRMKWFQVKICRENLTSWRFRSHHNLDLISFLMPIKQTWRFLEKRGLPGCCPCCDLTGRC